MEQITISIKRREVYGNTLIYVCEPQHAEALRRLTGKKTIDERDIKALEVLGVKIYDCDQVLKAIVAGTYQEAK